MLFVHGIGQLPVGTDEFLLKCPSCKLYSWADVVVASKYFHIYGFPIGPVDKEANAICKKCGLKRQVLLDETLISNYNEVKSKFRHPWVVYSGLGLAATIVASIIVAVTIS